ncbi:MAG: PAS domain S-box protein [Bacteroidetes bacterium]|nr:PAS domain S-box protein [Bacteroidota bacterium]
MQRTLPFSPRAKLLAAGLMTLAVIITAFVWFEVTRSREELLGFVASEAGVLIETVNRSTATTVEANAELEEAIVQRLRIAAQLIDARTQGGTPNAAGLEGLARETALDRIMLFDGDGRLRASDDPTASVGEPLSEDSDLRRDLLQPVLDGEYEWLAEGAVVAPPDSQRMFVLAQERRDAPGAVLLGLSSTAMLDMRLRLGIGTLLRDIGTASSILYIVLQDDAGIITASGGVKEMHSIQSDPFLLAAMRQDSAHSRILQEDDEAVFEIVQRVTLQHDAPALMRIGLSLVQVRAIQQRSMRRVILIALGFFITASILFVLILTRQRYGMLRQEHRKVRGYTDLVLDSIADAVVATDAAGAVTVYNQAAANMLGGSADHAIGRPCEAVCPGDVLLLRRTREQALPVPYEERTLEHPSGDRRVLAISTSVIRDDTGTVETIVSIARDMTEQRRVQEQLQRRDRVVAMGELAGGIAHEIRNPLNAINIIAQRFQQEFVPTEDGEEYTQLASTIRSEVQRVNRIITQFLEFARPPRLDMRPCDLTTLLSASLDIVRSQAAAREVTLPLITDAPTMVLADRERMTQVLLNIYQNALDAVEPGGMVKTVICAQGSMVAVSIADNGHGMPEDVRKNIFNLYFTTKTSGTGLGLSIVHQIVNEHGGEIHVASNEDGGSTFQILLPLLPAHHTHTNMQINNVPL